MPIRLLAVVCLIVNGILLRAAAGQPPPCILPANSHEARLLAFYSAPLAFSPATAPELHAPFSVRVGVEVAPLPSPDTALQHTGVCYLAKSEHTQLASIFPRPRVTVWLPLGFEVEASYDPPVPIDEAKVDIGSLAVSNTRHLVTLPGADLLLMIRAHGTLGQIRGPITCPRSALQLRDSTAACYGTQPSDDTFNPDMFGVESAVGATALGGRLEAYVGGGISWLRPRFNVGFHDLSQDYSYYGTHLIVNLTRGTVFGGLTLRVTPAIDVSSQVYAVPSDATTFRFGLGYRFGP